MKTVTVVLAQAEVIDVFRVVWPALRRMRNEVIATRN